MTERSEPKPAPLSGPRTAYYNYLEHRDQPFAEATQGDPTQAFSVAEINRALRRIDEIDTRTKRHRAPARKNLSWQAALVLIIALVTITSLAAWIVFLVAT